ncbi:hypothetical protein [Archangium sp.]|uniref:hypothetical protein n=1 Tax=Archangium sp. TaxID=1872627 RepID=UPI00389B1C0F
MENVPDIEEAITRFNQGCATFERALAAVRAQNFQGYEAESRTAWVEVVGALEWAVKYCLERFCAERMTPEALTKVDQDTFEKLLRRIAQHARPRFDRARARDLHTCRKWRNRITHEAALAPHRELQNAFRAIRQFLTGHLPVLEEQLSSLAMEPRDVESSTSEAERSSEFQPAHRQEGEAWITRVLQEGIEKLRHGRAQRYDATIASLEAEALEFLTRHALALLDAGRGTSGPLEHRSEGMEEEVREILLRSLDTGVSQADTERLRRLVPLLNRYPALCIEAGWLRKTDEGPSFADAHLPAMLVGRHLAHHAVEADRLSERVGRDHSWAEAAWMAISAGDDLASWANHVLTEQDPLRLIERVVVTCAAFGATPPRTAASEEMARAYALCVSALATFAPRHTNDIGESEPDSPWFLPRERWLRCVLDLAQASWILDAGLALRFERDMHPRAPSPLAALLSALEFPSRLSPEEASVIAALCAPLPAARRGLLDATFFTAVFSPRSRVGALVAEPFLENWMRNHGIPALRRGGSTASVRMLALPEGGHPAGYLLNRTGLLQEWFQAWIQLTSVELEASCRAWVEAVLRLAGLDDATEALRDLLLVECLKRLEVLGMKPRALHALREAYLPVWPRTEGDEKGEPFRTNVAILRLLGLTASEWTERIEAWMDKPALGWRTLIAAGAPHAPIARWCVRKFREREQAPEPYRHEPVGVFAVNAQALSTGPWQLAFQQAPEALKWLLAEGDASALSVLADACLDSSSEQPRFDPPMSKLLGITQPLSMKLWGLVFSRPAGREALYARVERNARLGDIHFFEDPLIPDGELQVWLRLVFELWRPHLEGGSLSDLVSLPVNHGTEAQRLLACFERRMLSEPSAEGDGLRDPWARAWPGLPAKAFVIACAAAQGVDVAAPLQLLFEQAPRASHHHTTMAARWLGYALLRLSEHHPLRANALLDRALCPELLGLMGKDDTAAFWMVLARRHGSGRVLAAVDQLGLRDTGLGLVDALLRLDLQALRERELRPELLRPLLIRASERAYVPSARFWEGAWQVERSAEEIPELPLLAVGTWLKEMLDKTTGWAPLTRRTLLQHLARLSIDEEVRRRCLTGLLNDASAGMQPSAPRNVRPGDSTC